MEKSLVLIKPDGVQRGLIGEIISRLEKRGLKLVAAKLIMVHPELAEEHYAIHKGKFFYTDLIKYIASSPVFASVWEGRNAIAAVRQTMGATRPIEAAPGTVRHDYGLETGRNLSHASDSLENAENEISLWFSKDELFEWNRNNDVWIFEPES